MPPPLAKAIGLEIKRCMLAKAQESASGTAGVGGWAPTLGSGMRVSHSLPGGLTSLLGWL